MDRDASLDVLILCGGLGTRLRQTVGATPKVLAEVAGQPFLDRILTQLKTSGFPRVILGSGHQADVVEARYREHDFGLDIHFSREQKPLGTGGAIKLAAPLIRSQNFLVLNGDSFCPVDFKALIDFHVTRRALATIVLSRVQDSKDFGQVSLDSNQRILRFLEKDPAQSAAYVNGGVYCFSKDFLTRLPQAASFSLEKEVFPQLTAEAFYGFVVAEDFVDIGTPERYRKAQKFFNTGE